MEEPLKWCDEWRQIRLNRIPNDVELHNVVVMGQDVPHTLHLRPWNLRVSPLYFGGNFPSRLANYEKVANHGVDDELI